MATTRNAPPPLIQKDAAWMLQARANAPKYRSALALRDEQRLTWREIGEKMHYSQSQARRIYYRAKMLLEIAAKNPRMQSVNENRADTVPSGKTTAAPPFITQEQARLIRARINWEKYRTVLILRDEHHLTFKEIAERMRFSRSYVTTLYHRAVYLKQIAA